MKKLLLTVTTVFSICSIVNAQVFDSLSTVSNGTKVRDLVSDGANLFAAVGQDGVFKSTDDGVTWTACGTLPDAGFGEEGAYALKVTSNGRIVVGGSTHYGGSPFASFVWSSTDNGVSWGNPIAISGLSGYENPEKIVQLSNGTLILQGGQGKFFVGNTDADTWSQGAAPGGVVNGFTSFGDTVIASNNPAGGTAGLWYSADDLKSWNRYGSNNTDLGGGSVTISAMLITKDYKFIGQGGASDGAGIYRAGLSDTTWLNMRNGLDSKDIYPTGLVSDNKTVWMIYEGIGQCYLTSTSDFGANWSAPVGNQVRNSILPACMTKLIIHKTHVYTITNGNIYRIKDVAVTNGGNNGGGSNGIAEVNKESFSVFPNPSEGVLNVLNQGSNYEVYDLWGSLEYFGNATSLNLNTGVFIFKMKGKSIKVLVK